MVTLVKRRSRSTQRAAPDPGCAGSNASSASDFPLVSPIMASVIDIELLFVDRKSDIAQKKVTVCDDVSHECIGRKGERTDRKGDIEIVILRAKLIEGINEAKKTHIGKGG